MDAIKPETFTQEKTEEAFRIGKTNRFMTRSVLMAASSRLISLLMGLIGSIAPIRSAEESSSTKSAQQIMESARDSIVVIRQTGRDGGTGGVGTGF